MERYRGEEKIGEGAFSMVLKAEDTETGLEVALKKIWLNQNTTRGAAAETDLFPPAILRELQALRFLNHPNVIQLLDVFAHGNAMVLVTERMKCDLQELMHFRRRFFTQGQVKSILVQLLRGVQHCHELCIMHRDLKPANLLLDSKGVLKIADFGLARIFSGPTVLYSHQVATRWYRAPELLFGARKYTPSVDMWAVGCIFAELLNHSPLFPGENDIDQLFQVLRVMGTPTEAMWPGLTQLPDYNKIFFDPMPGIPLAEILPNASPEAIALLEKILVFNPAVRLSATEALRDPYFFTEPLPSPPSELISGFVRDQSAS
eukprot:gnl/Spiro4/770_TR419_c0_g1_i1.p1 gnl/Spiro4/770_TR419_c0_g1~~gnl/Spiro4/770_TR419_c0_g1_i1.p1  ORF type:complete len:318 (-),score=24.54 gnl/Spiro4/770_TR419_c0_g1_i1:44-997(-)